MQTQKTHPQRAPDQQTDTSAPTERDPETADLLDDTDELLDAIDEALGDEIQHAEEFVRAYIQKGGE
ncbi:MAG: ubiquitin-like protein Pup [Nocardioidaceae bacterium]